MIDKQLKRIAEAHYYTGKPLSYIEYDALKNTEYANVINKPSIFKGLIESLDIPDNPKQRRRGSDFNGGIDKRTVKNLIDDVEERFNLEIFNVDAGKYKNVNIDELRNFVSNWNKRNVMDQDTTDCIDRALEHDNVYLVLAKLCWACT
jgi:hypothetical protein